MRRVRHPVFECIRKTLISQYDAIVQEPLPQRWAELIRHLTEKERISTELRGETQKPAEQ